MPLGHKGFYLNIGYPWMRKEDLQQWWETRFFRVENDHLYLGNKNLELIAQKFGTPLYVYDLRIVKENYLRIKSSFEKYKKEDIDCIIYYAMKANGADELLLFLREENPFVDTSSVGEVKKAIKTGYSPQNIIFTGTNFGLNEYDFLAKSGILFNVDSFSQLERLKKFAPLDISIRFNPAIGGVGFNERFEMSGNSIRGSRLGVHKEKIIDIFLKAREYGLNPICLHQHVGSNWLRHEQFEPYFNSVREGVHVIQELEKLGFKIETLNLGGGMGVKSHEKYPEFPLDQFMFELWNIINQSNIKIKKLAIEPGRYLVGNSGVLLTTVNSVEEKNNINFCGVDAGFNVYHHNFLYQIESEIINVSKVNQKLEQTYAISGYLGEQADVFTEVKEMPLTEESDIIAFFPAGAYCSSELAIHHDLPVPKELFLNGAENEQGLSLQNYCKACQKSCCFNGPINLLNNEFQQIFDRTKNINDFIYKEEIYLINNKINEPCRFLNKDGITCDIQDIKPVECQAYPIFRVNEDGIRKTFFHEQCPASSFLSSNYVTNARLLLDNISDNLLNLFNRFTNDGEIYLKVYE